MDEDCVVGVGVVAVVSPGRCVVHTSTYWFFEENVMVGFEVDLSGSGGCRLRPGWRLRDRGRI